MSGDAAVARLVASLDGTGAVFLQLAAGAVIVIGVAGAVREAARWYAAWGDDEGRDEPLPVVTAPAATRTGIVAETWARVRSAAMGVPPRLQHARAAAPARHHSRARRSSAPRTRAIALADAGADRAEIARRTGLSRDAVALALALRR